MLDRRSLTRRCYTVPAIGGDPRDENRHFRKLPIAGHRLNELNLRNGSHNRTKEDKIGHFGTFWDTVRAIWQNEPTAEMGGRP